MRTHRLLVFATACASVSAAAEAPESLHARALAATCTGCHGTNGVSQGAMPTLAGRSRDELLRALTDFKTGARPSTVMQQLAKGYTDAQLEAIASWFASAKEGTAR